MLIKFDADDDLVHRLKMETGSAVASKAFHIAAAKYLHLLDHAADLQRRNAELRDQLKATRQVIHDARASAAALLERVGQEDLFID